MAQRLKCPPPMWETRVRSLGQEDPLEKEMAKSHGRRNLVGSSCPWGHDWVTSLRNQQRASLGAQTVKNLLAMIPGWEDLLERGTATYYSIFSWRIPWTKEPSGLPPWGSREADTTEQLSLSLLPPPPPRNQQNHYRQSKLSRAPF